MSSIEKHDSENRVRDFSRLPQGPVHKKAKIKASTASQAMWFGATDPLLGCVFFF